MANTDLSKSQYIQRYIEEMTAAMLQMNPLLDKKDVKKIILKEVEKKFSNPTVTLDNNFTHETKNASLLSVIDWAHDRKPILAGNGTFYKNQEEAINPIANMLETMGTTRKSLKKQMFKFNESAPEYKALDLGQANEKINMNSYYGGSGTPVSAFYSQWSGPATTLTAQSVISTTETAFEGFLADNYKFIDINEFIDWAKCVREETKEMDAFIMDIPVDRLFNRLRKNFLKFNEKWSDCLFDYVSHLTDEERKWMFYKNNIRDFTSDHPKIQNLYYKIFKNVENIPYAKTEDDISNENRERFIKDIPWYNPNKIVKEYNSWVNTQRFLNPNEAPATIKDDLRKLSDYYIKYCYVRYLVPDRIHRLKFFIRRAVVIVDTDSNMLNCQPWVRYLKKHVLCNETFDRDAHGNMFIGVNSIAYILTNMVTDILLWYGEKSNIPEKYRPKFNMKNEFLFTKLIISKKKKRYLSSIILREGNLYDPVRIDEKGLDYIKSGTSETAMKFYRGLTVKYLLDTEDLDVRGMFDELKEFRKKIRDSLYNGEKTYLPNASAKDADAYKDPWSNQSVRGVYAWNAIYPDRQISVPCKLNLVKLNIFTENDIEPLKTSYPDVYNALKRYIFDSGNEKLIKHGCKVLAIPGNVKQMPEWVRNFVDYETMISDVLSPFKCVMDLVKMKQFDVGKTSTRKSKMFSNIVSF